jgi:hypothetical protein
MEENYKIIDEAYKGDSELVLSHSSQNYLNETLKWAKFLAIIMFILGGIMVLVGMATLITAGSISPAPFMGYSSIFLGFMIIAMALLYFFPAYYLYQFSDKMKLALQNQHAEQLDESFRNLKSHYKFIGTLLMIVLSFYAVILIFGLFGLIFR